MDKGKRLSGREKRVTQGSGKVHRRGDGLHMGGPVGSQDGYSDRHEGGDAPNRSAGGKNNILMMIAGMLFQMLFSRNKGQRSLAWLILLCVGGYFAFSFLHQGSQETYQDGNNSAGTLMEGGHAGNQSGSGLEALEDLLGGGSKPGQGGNTGAGHMLPFGGNQSQGSSNRGVLDTSVSEKARGKRTVLKGNGNDTTTIMIYMCGTDLESKSGMATSDLQEMLGAAISDKVNVIVETGGCERWQNTAVSNRTNQIFQVTAQGLKTLEEHLGLKSMVDPATLSDFIRYCKANFPANRYQLILWDHGGGSVGGYGYDQNFPNGTMTLDKIHMALKDGGCSFDFIGFDACLMATLETALLLEPYADYLIASEETEPGTGWYYTGWLTALSENTSIPTIELGKIIVDDFVADSARRSPSALTTLSVVDLAELKGTVPQAFTEFSEATTQLIQQNDYKVVSNARSNAKEFAKSAGINQVDLIHLAENMGTDASKELANALRGTVKYNQTSKNMGNAYGLSVYFPYGKLGKLNSMLSTYRKIGLDEEYSKCIASFANLEAGGQMATGGDNSPMGGLLGTLLGGDGSFTGSSTQQGGGSMGSDVLTSLLGAALSNGNFSSLSGVTASNSGWLDQGQIMNAVSYLADNRVHTDKLVFSEKNGSRVLKLPEDQWDLIQNVELNVFVDDGEGFIDLGLDNTFSFDTDGDLEAAYDKTWLALNGQIVSYYFVSEESDGDSYKITGRIPAMLNGEKVDLMLVFTEENPYGTVLGASINYDGKIDTLAKGVIELKDGDRLDILCDYYSYEESFQDNYYLGDPIVVNGEPEISNVELGDYKYIAAYRLTDIYHNHYWTPQL